MDLDLILHEKKPPPGGLVSLRSRIRRRQHRHRMGVRLVWGLAAVCLLLASFTGIRFVLNRPPAYSPWLAHGSMSLVSLGLEQPTNTRAAVSLTPGETMVPIYADEEVVYYQRIRLNSGGSRTDNAGPAN